MSSLRLTSSAARSRSRRLRSGGCAAELPAHHVGAHPLERVLRLDHVAPRAVHLAAVLVEHLLVAEHAPERRLAGEHDRHEELRVEPEPDLLAHLADPVGREPLLPVGVVGQVGASSAPSPRRCRSPPSTASGFCQPSVENGTMPASSQTSPTSLTRSTGSPHSSQRIGHAVDPRPPQLLELVEPVDRALLELGPRPDHVQMPARARVERQRQAVVAAAGDVPVAHVAEPVVHALAHVLGRPLDRRVRVEHRLPQVVGRR